ncbi:MAG: ethylbenzene dehydrogenase-related protein [Thermodesulfobacteriota bacterium]
MKKCYLALLATTMILALGGIAQAADDVPTVTAKEGAAPTLDGDASDWASIPATVVKVNPAQEGDTANTTGTIDVELKSVVSGDTIYFLAQWPDDSKDDTHKTLIWNKEKETYDTGDDEEDRIAFSFTMEGDYMYCMLAGSDYKADAWQWKAYRSGSAGLIHDKYHIASSTELPKAKKHAARNGKEIWLARPSDAGDELYTSQRPIDNIGDKVPKYLVNANATGSIADVKAKGVWADNKWTVEISRKLDTGHDDDIKFEKGKTIKSGLAVFNHTGDDHHSIAGWNLAIE